MTEVEYLKEYFRDTVFKNQKDKTLSAALDKAYADMSRRASGHSKDIKNACKDWLETEFSQLPAKAKEPDFDFDVWHEETCQELINKMNDKKTGFGTAGRAQKVINMAFKYLSCISGDYDALLPSCHMTLDGYTLAWYKKDVMPWVKEKVASDKEKGFSDVEALTEWSKITRDDYMLIQSNIRKYLQTTPAYSITIGGRKTESITLSAVPFDAEFVIWEGEIVKGKYELLVKELKKYAEKYRGVEAGRIKDAWIAGDLFENYLNGYCKKLKKMKRS